MGQAGRLHSYLRGDKSLLRSVEYLRTFEKKGMEKRKTKNIDSGKFKEGTLKPMKRKSASRMKEVRTIPDGAERDLGKVGGDFNWV